jgi:hypothetical protein
MNSILRQYEVDFHDGARLTDARRFVNFVGHGEYLGGDQDHSYEPYEPDSPLNE